MEVDPVWVDLSVLSLHDSLPKGGCPPSRHALSSCGGWVNYTWRHQAKPPSQLVQYPWEENSSTGSSAASASMTRLYMSGRSIPGMRIVCRTLWAWPNRVWEISSTTSRVPGVELSSRRCPWRNLSRSSLAASSSMRSRFIFIITNWWCLLMRSFT